MKSPKQVQLEKKITKSLLGIPQNLSKALFDDLEIAALQDYANTVSITRLTFNDHGPVHMRQVMKNAIRLHELLTEAQIPLNLEKEGLGTAEDSLVVVMTAAFLHDVGMSVGRENHEMMSATLVQPILHRLLSSFYPGDLKKQVILRSMITEAIAGHMGTQKVHSLEAGIVLIADGCDMEKGRARIPLLITKESRAGDIHKYSSSAIAKVRLVPGEKKPIRILIDMTESVGFFQRKEVLLPKINSSPLKPRIELLAGVKGQEMKKYL